MGEILSVLCSVCDAVCHDFPAILTATASIWSGAAALVVGSILAYCKKSLFQVSIVSCAVVFCMEWILPV